jgi:hypothetical protein
MASKRTTILGALATRFGAVSGWTAVVRDALDSVNAQKVIYLYDRDESARTDAHVWYDCELDVLGVIRVRAEDASGNVFDYVDDCLVELQQVLHTAPTEYGVSGVMLVVQRGHQKQPPDERNMVGVEWRLRVDYRHDYKDPESWTGAF